MSVNLKCCGCSKESPVEQWKPSKEPGKAICPQCGKSCIYSQPPGELSRAQSKVIRNALTPNFAQSRSDSQEPEKKYPGTLRARNRRRPSCE